MLPPILRKRWARRLLGISLSAIILGWLALHFILPAIIERQVIEVFQAAGVQDVKFNLRKATPWQTNIAALTGGRQEWLKVGEITIDYSPIDAIRGNIALISIRQARIVLPLHELPGLLSQKRNSKSAATSIPVRSIQLESCILALRRGERTLDLALNGTLAQDNDGASQLKLNAAFEKSRAIALGTIDLPSSKSDVSIETGALNLRTLLELAPLEAQRAISDAGGTFAFRIEDHREPAAARTSANIELKDAFIVGKGGYEGEIRGLNANLAIANLLPLTIPSAQAIRVSSIKFAGQEFSNISLKAESKSIEDIRISDAQLDWAGGRISAEPFTIAASLGAVQLAMAAEHVDIGQVLAVVSQGRATGSGTVSGRAPIKIDGLQVAVGDGVFESDGPGNLRLGESIAALSDVLDQTDPRFTQDAQMAQVKQQILEALTDFQYDRARADLKRVDDELFVSVNIVGRGRLGAKQPLNLTLNFRGFEHGVNTYLAGYSRVLNLKK